MTATRPLKNADFWLLGIGASLIAIHLTLFLRDNNVDFFGISLVVFAAASFLVWEKRHSLNLESGIFSSFLGLSIIALIFLNSACPINFGGLFLLSPLISGIGLALLASGFKGLKQYWKALLAVFYLSVNTALSINATDISPLTAKFAAYILWYAGFQASLSGVNIALQTGGVEVLAGCSGKSVIILLLTLAGLFILIFPLNWQQKILVPIVAAILGFIVNGVRIALMAILVAKSQQQAFEYWHDGDGSLIFVMIAVLLFGCFCQFLLHINQTENQNLIEYLK